MKSEREGQYFGKKCWKQGIGVDETVRLAGLEEGIESLGDDPARWPRFVHGAEEAWQDLNLAHRDSQEQLASITEKYTGKS